MLPRGCGARPTVQTGLLLINRVVWEALPHSPLGLPSLLGFSFYLFLIGGTLETTASMTMCSDPAASCCWEGSCRLGFKGAPADQWTMCSSISDVFRQLGFSPFELNWLENLLWFCTSCFSWLTCILSNSQGFEQNSSRQQQSVLGVPALAGPSSTGLLKEVMRCLVLQALFYLSCVSYKTLGSLILKGAQGWGNCKFTTEH